MMNEPLTQNVGGLELMQPTALESIERANVDMQISTAKKYPRSLALVKRRMLDLATLDQETAESCFYKLNRQGKSIEGPSIRLAEIAASSFGNIRYGARVISNDGKKITAQGFSHDLETNVFCAVEISRRITNREGQTYSEDMQVVTGNAACAIALRNAMFKVVPFALVKPIFEAAKHAAVGDIKTLADRRTTMLKKFAALGVNEKRVCAVLDKAGVEEIGLAELETLIGLHNAVRDGEQTVEEAFPVMIEKAKIVNGAAPATTATEDKPTPRSKKLKPAKAKETTPPATTEPEQPATAGPNALEVYKRLQEEKFTVPDLAMVCIKNEWIDPPQGYTGKREELADVPLASFGEEKLGEIIESWDVVADQMSKLVLARRKTKGDS
jgi:hypothetical protein